MKKPLEDFKKDTKEVENMICQILREYEQRWEIAVVSVDLETVNPMCENTVVASVELVVDF